MAAKTFSDNTSFNTYLSDTDDCMQALMGIYLTSTQFYLVFIVNPYNFVYSLLK